eukprot:6213707-Pleurochrysis_carterae.AAC.6
MMNDHPLDFGAKSSQVFGCEAIMDHLNASVSLLMPNALSYRLRKAIPDWYCANQGPVPRQNQQMRRNACNNTSLAAVDVLMSGTRPPGASCYQFRLRL